MIVSVIIVIASSDAILRITLYFTTTGEHENALQLFDQAERVIRKLPVPLLETARAYSLIHLQRYADAERALQHAQRTLDTLSDPRTRLSTEASTLAYTGLIYHKRDHDSTLCPTIRRACAAPRQGKP